MNTPTQKKPETAGATNKTLMPDTLYSKITALSLKVDSLNTKIDSLSNKSSFSLWTPILAALITAIIGTLLAQAIDLFLKTGTKKGKIYVKCNPNVLT